MKQKLLVVVAIVIAVAFVSLAFSPAAHASSPSDSPGQAAATNQATIDVTINDAGEVSAAGMNLRALGVAPIDGQTTTLAKNLNNVHLVVQGSEVTVDVQGTQVAKLLWTPDSRQAVANLALRYGVQLQPEFESRLEEWISTSNIDVTARFANETSKPASIALSKLLLVDVAANGQLAIERAPLAAAIDATTLATMQRAGSQATVCWNKGTVTSKLDGAAMPTLILNPDGVALVTKALNLSLDQGATNSVLGSKLGVDLSLPGGTHTPDATCE